MFYKNIVNSMGYFIWVISNVAMYGAISVVLFEITSEFYVLSMNGLSRSDVC